MAKYLKCFIFSLKFILTILVLILLPFIISTFCILIVVRFLIAKLAPFLNPSLGKMLPARESALASSEFYTLLKNPKVNIVTDCTVQGDVDISTETENFTRNVLQAKLPGTDELLYPELQQYLTTWAGFWFWKPDKIFKISHHFKLYEKCKSDDDRFTESDIHNIRQELLELKWEKNKPLWEVILVRNFYPSGGTEGYEGPHTVMIGRIHHTLGDGYAWLNLITKRLCSTKEEFSNVAPTKNRKGRLETLLFWVTLPLLLAHTLVEWIIVRPLLNQLWKVQPEKQKTTRGLVELGNKISVSRLKEIKDYFGVNFSTVIYALFSGVQHDMLKKENLKFLETTKCAVILPLPRRTEKLRNFMTYYLITLPINEPDPIKRLKFCQKEFESMKKSAIPILVSLCTKGIGSLPICIGKKLASNQIASSGISIFPGGTTDVYFAGHKYIDCCFTVGLQGCTGIGCFCMSYKDNLRICVTGASEIFTTEDVHEMNLLFQKHVEILLQHTII